MSADTILRSALHDYRVVTVVDALVQPWSIAFLPGGDILDHRAPGPPADRAQRQAAAAAGRGRCPPVSSAGSQGGLLEVAPHPNFAPNRLLYLTYSKPLGDGKDSDHGAHSRPLRERPPDERRSSCSSRCRRAAATTAARSRSTRTASSSSRWAIARCRPRASLEAHPAQDLTNHHGKIIRLHDDGRVPADNPFVKSRRREAGDLELRPSQRAGPRHSPGDRRRAGPTSTARRAATSSTASCPARTTAGR